MFENVASRLKNKQVLYLEFGVHKGESIKYWAKLLNDSSMLIGFDSFEGLPESWGTDSNYKKGALSTGGKIPVINDKRIKFFKGWFNEVLPKYTLPNGYDVLVIYLDADLYSSTKYVLNHFTKYINPGTYIGFDDMNRPDHEPRAFKEFIDETGKKFKLVVTDYAQNRSFFQCLS